MMERFDYSIATMRPTRQQKLFAGAVAAVLLVGFLATAPFAATRVVRLDSFVPTLGAIIFVTDLTTSVLLFSQYASIGSRGLLVLANGYLFSALVVIPHSLSFPAAFAENGLLVFGPQTTPWLYTFWHLGFSAAVLVYACIKKRTENNGRADTPSKSPIFWNVTGTLLLAATLTVIAIVEEESLPRLVLNQVAFSPLASHVTAVTLITSVIALVVLGFGEIDPRFMVVSFGLGDRCGAGSCEYSYCRSFQRWILFESCLLRGCLHRGYDGLTFRNGRGLCAARSR